MSKVNLEYDFYSYPKVYVYRLAKNFGTRLVDFLGVDLLKLLLDTEVLIGHSSKDLYCISENTYKLHPSAKALEGFLEKVVRGKNFVRTRATELGMFLVTNSQLPEQKCVILGL